MGRLDVRIVEARNLPNTSTFGKVDPYVVVTLENTTHKTSVQDSTVNPKWDEIFKFVVADPDSAQLVLKVWAKNLVSDDFLGEYKMNLSGLTKGEVKDSWVLLQQCKANSEIRVRLVAHDFGFAPAGGVPATVPASPSTPSSLASSLTGTGYAAAAAMAPAAPAQGYGPAAGVPVGYANPGPQYPGGGPAPAPHYPGYQPQPGPAGYPPMAMPMQMPMQMPMPMPMAPAVNLGMPMPMNLGIPEGAVCYLQPLHAGGSLVLDCSRAGTQSGTKIITWACNKTAAHQKFRFHMRANGTVSFHPLHAQHLALDSGRHPKSDITAWQAKEDNNNQGWILEPVQQRQNCFWLRAHHGTYLEVDLGIGGGQGSKLTTGDRNGNPNQQFMIAPA